MSDPVEQAVKTVERVADVPLLTYAWVIGLSVWGGAVSFVQKIRNGSVRPFNLVELVGEFVVSAFVGIVTFWLAQAANIGELYTAALVAITSHMGTRALFKFEQWASRRFLGVDIDVEGPQP